MLRSLLVSMVVLQTCGSLMADGDPGIVSEKPSEGRSVKVEAGYMVPYRMKIPGTDVSFEMVPIPGGEFLMGSPDSEASRDESEGPQRRFHVDPFWMGRYEVRWNEYKQYMELYAAFKKFRELNIRRVTDENSVDVVTSPTPLYDPTFTFEFGEDPMQPAITVSQYAAKQYTKWLSAITGQQHRLPTEAEWEYACRAGTTTAYSYGDDPSKLGDYAWFVKNTEDSGTKLTGAKQPNPWGLFDMHGNAAEWVLDAYAPYEATDRVLNAATDWVRPTQLNPRVVRGGTWEFGAAQCRSASRYPSDYSAWRETDPNFPKSPWWFTDDPGRGVGFRIIRPLKEVSREQMEEFWKVDVDETMYEVDERIETGRGVQGIVDKDLPAAIEKLED
ncbi:MAG: formylglycine-generating enzyme family protein [Planctomycetaceae bacterium]